MLNILPYLAHWLARDALPRPWGVRGKHAENSAKEDTGVSWEEGGPQIIVSPRNLSDLVLGPDPEQLKEKRGRRESTFGETVLLCLEAAATYWLKPHWDSSLALSHTTHQSHNILKHTSIHTKHIKEIIFFSYPRCNRPEIQLFYRRCKEHQMEKIRCEPKTKHKKCFLRGSNKKLRYFVANFKLDNSCINHANFLGLKKSLC